MSASRTSAAISALLARWRDPLGRSVLSLYALQLASYALPLLTIPYLTRELGVATFGVYGFLIAFSRVGNLFTDWGFPFSATRDIAQHLERGESIDATFSAAMWARGCLLGVWVAAAFALTQWTGFFIADATLVWISVLAVAGSTFFPLWLFQAYERLPLVIGFALAVRVITTALVFVLVTSPEDVDIALWLYAIPWLATAAFALWAARQTLGVRFIRQPARAVLKGIQGGTSVFVTLAAATAYTSANTLLLGVITGDTTLVGYFFAAETAVLAAVGLITPLSQAVYPRSSRVALDGVNATVSFARSLLPWFVALGGALSLVLFVFAPLGTLVFGPDFEQSVRLLRIMSGIPLAVSLYAVFGAQLMLPLRMDRMYSLVIVGVGLASLALTAILVPRFEETGTAVVALTAEVSIVAALVVVMLRRDIWIGRKPQAPGS